MFNQIVPFAAMVPFALAQFAVIFALIRLQKSVSCLIQMLFALLCYCWRDLLHFKIVQDFCDKIKISIESLMVRF